VTKFSQLTPVHSKLFYEVKVDPVLNWAPHHKGVLRSGDVALRIRGLGAGWGSVAACASCTRWARARLVPEQVWTRWRGGILGPCRESRPDLPVRDLALYQLRYPGSVVMCYNLFSNKLLESLGSVIYAFLCVVLCVGRGLRAGLIPRPRSPTKCLKGSISKKKIRRLEKA
jgi:hypothetical protein